MVVLGNLTNKLPCVHLLFNWWIDPNDFKKDRNSSTLTDAKKSDSAIHFMSKCFDFDRKVVSISVCNYTGNLAINFGTMVSIYRYKQSKSSSPAVDHLVDLKLSFYCRFVSYAHPYISFASNSHCMLLHLQVQEENEEIEIKLKSTNGSMATNTLLDCQPLNLPIFLHASFDSSDDKSTALAHSGISHPEIVIGPADARLTCRVELEPNTCLPIVSCEANILLCRQMASNNKTYEDEQFEIVERDGYSQVFQKYKGNQSHNRNRIQQLELEPLWVKQVNSHPLEDCLESEVNPSSKKESKLIGFNFFIVMPTEIFAYRLYETRVISMGSILKFAIDDPIKQISLDNLFIQVVTQTSLRLYWSGLCDSYSFASQVKLDRLNCQLPVIGNQLFCQPILLCQHNFLSPEKLLNNMNDLFVITFHSSSYTGYALRKPSIEQLMNDSYQSFLQKSPETHHEQLRFLFFLISLGKRIRFNRTQKKCDNFIDISQKTFNLMPKVFTTDSSGFWNNWIQITFDYLDLLICELEHFSTKLDLDFSPFTLLSSLFLQNKLRTFAMKKQTNCIDAVLPIEIPPENFLCISKLLKNNLNLLNFVLFNYNFKLNNDIKELLDWLDRLDDEHHLIAKVTILFDLNQLHKIEFLLGQVDDAIWVDQIQTFFKQIRQHPSLFQLLLSRKTSAFVNIFQRFLRYNTKFCSDTHLVDEIRDSLLQFFVLDTLFYNFINTSDFSSNMLDKLVRGQIKVITHEWTDSLVHSKFNVNFVLPTSVQSPLLNLLAPQHTENSDSDDSTIKDDAPNFSKSRCFCCKCTPFFSKLQQVLYMHKGITDELRSELDRFCAEDLPSTVAWTIQVLYLEFEPSIDLLLTNGRESIVFFCVEKYLNRNQSIWRKLFQILEQRLSVRLDCKLMHQLMYHLSTHMSLCELSEILPNTWKEIATHYLQIAIQKQQAKELCNDLMIRAEKMLMKTPTNAF